MLRDTEGEVAAPCYFCVAGIFQPLRPSDPSPIFCLTTKHPVGLRDMAGEEGEMYSTFAFTPIYELHTRNTTGPGKVGG